MKLAIKRLITFQFLIFVVDFLVCTLLLCCEVIIDSSVVNTMFTVSSIMFSIAIGLTANPSTEGVNDSDAIKRIRLNFRTVESALIVTFSFSVVTYVLSIFLPQPIKINVFDHQYYINMGLITTLYQIFVSVIIVYTFYSIKKFNENREDFARKFR